MTSDGDVSHFSAVDSGEDPQFFIRFLDYANTLPTIRAAKRLLFDQLRLSTGDTILDVGCGTGADVLDLAAYVGKGGRVVGIDISEMMLAEAKRRAPPAGARTVEYRRGNAEALPFGDATFDACRSERTLLHLHQTELAISEMVRVTRSGGRVAIFDLDMDTVVVDSPHKATTRAVTRAMCDGLASGWIGRQIARMLSDNQMRDICILPHTVVPDFQYFQMVFGGLVSQTSAAGHIAQWEIDRWWDDLRERNACGTFFAAYTGFSVAGTKP